MHTGPATGAPAADSGVRRVAGNTVVRAAGEVLAKAGSLAFYVVLARRLGTEDYGAFMFALALTGALLIGAGFGTDDLIARQISRDRSTAGFHLANVAALKVVTSVALLAVAMLVVLVGGYPAETRIATLLVGIGVALEVMAKSWHAIFQAHERLGFVSACLVLQRMTTAVVGIAVLLAGGGLVAAAAVYAGGAALALVAAEVMLRRAIGAQRPRATRTAALEHLRAGVPIGIAGLFFVLLQRVDVLMLSFLGDNRQVGLYAAGYRLVEGLQFLAWSFDAAMLPWIARAASAAALARGLMLGFKLEAAVLLPVGLLMSCFAGPIVALLYGDAFSGATTPLTLLGVTIVFYALQTFSATALIARDAPAVFARAAGLVAVQNIACNAVAIPLAGADGAAAVALSSSFLLAFVAVLQVTRRSGGIAFGRAFGGPLAAGAALVAVALALPLPAIPAGIAAALAYAAVLLAIEFGLHRDDVAAYRSALPTGVASRFRGGRTTA